VPVGVQHGVVAQDVAAGYELPEAGLQDCMVGVGERQSLVLRSALLCIELSCGQGHYAHNMTVEEDAQSRRISVSLRRESGGHRSMLSSDLELPLPSVVSEQTCIIPAVHSAQ